VIAGSWTVQPYLIEKDPQGSALQPNIIRIRPGLGFGTGHHSTTRTTLELLQRTEFHPDSISRVLDLGTGSGILAIAAARIFSKPVTAIDIDDAALDNARHNAQINTVEPAIKFLTGSIERASGKYEVVIANIYAEVLVDLRDQIIDAVQEKGVLFLSGIREDKKDLVLLPYLEGGMSLQKSTLSEGWHSMVLRLK
jgi:ribosomal protein L11 methyltransferase